MFEASVIPMTSETLSAVCTQMQVEMATAPFKSNGKVASSSHVDDHQSCDCQAGRVADHQVLVVSVHMQMPRSYLVKVRNELP